MNAIKKFLKELFGSPEVRIREREREYLCELDENYISQNFYKFRSSELLYYKNFSEDFLLANLHRLDLLMILKTQKVSVNFLKRVVDFLPKSIKLSSLVILNKCVKNDVYMIIPMSHENIIQTGDRFSNDVKLETVSDYVLETSVSSVFSKVEILEFIDKTHSGFLKDELIEYVNYIDKKNSKHIKTAKDSYARKV